MLGWYSPDSHQQGVTLPSRSRSAGQEGRQRQQSQTAAKRNREDHQRLQTEGSDRSSPPGETAYCFHLHLRLPWRDVTAKLWSYPVWTTTRRGITSACPAAHAPPCRPGRRLAIPPGPSLKSFSTPRPARYRFPSRRCETAWSCSAPLRTHLAASLTSFGTPRPARYNQPEVALGRGAASRGGLAIPPHCFASVLFHPSPSAYRVPRRFSASSVVLLSGEGDTTWPLP